MDTSKGKLFVLEGIDGTGKSTQAAMLTEALNDAGFATLQSFEPTKGPNGMKLRESASSGRLSIEAELELFLADRKEHVETFINPTLAAGTNVVLDRYYFSTMAYQGARGLDPSIIRQQNEAFAPKPDVLFLVDLPVDLALERIGARDGAGDAFETKESLIRCQQIFQSLTGEHFAKMIDANRSIHDIHLEIFEIARGQLT